MTNSVSSEGAVKASLARHCAKCNCEDMLFIEATRGGYGSGNVIPLSGVFVSDAVKVNRFVCMSCGFCEEWILTPEDRELLKRYYGPGSRRARINERWNRWGKRFAEIKQLWFCNAASHARSNRESQP